MPKYVSFFTYSSETWGRMISAPGDRTAALRQVLDSVGGSFDAIYWMFGDYDGMVIFRGPRTRRRCTSRPGSRASRLA